MKEDIVFSLHKDKPVRNAKHFEKEMKEKYGNINTKELYLRIVNYQLDRYDHVLWNSENEYAGDKRKKAKNIGGLNGFLL